MTITKNDAGPDAKAPSVYLDDKVLAEAGGIREGKISEGEIIDELKGAGVPGRPK